MTKLSKAPVFLVIGQIRHSPVLKLDALIADFQERLRKKGYPRYNAKKETAFDIVVGDESRPGDTNARVNQEERTIHTLLNADESSALVVSPDNIIFRTTGFDGFEAFRETFLEGLAVYADVIGPDLVTSMGLRYLDAVIPEAGQSMADCVRREFLGLTGILGDDWGTAYDFYETVLQRDGQMMKFRAVARKNVIQFPIDLGNIVSVMPERIPKESVIHAVLDSDATFTPKEAMSFDVGAIGERLTALKKDISEVFKAVVTPEALKAWE